MVCIDTVNRMKKNLETNLKKIKESKYRFAVVNTDSITYYNNRYSLYRENPSLKPGSPPMAGTLPLLVDIGRLTNSIEYQREQINEEEEQLDESERENLIKRKDLGERAKKLN